MPERKVQVIRPAGMSGNDLDRCIPCTKILFQLLKRLHRQFVILRQRADEAVAAVRSKPDRITGEQIRIVDQVDQVAPGMSGKQDAFDLDASNLKHFAVFQ